MDMTRAECRFKFQAVPELFVDLAAASKAEQGGLSPYKVTTLPELGLQRDGLVKRMGNLESNKKSWEALEEYIHDLNEQGTGLRVYKVLYVTRHGLGYHNTFEAKVGREAWNNYWSHLDGDDQIRWADSRLTTEGIQQANTLSQFWINAVSQDKIPLPGTIYTSPLARCLETTRLVFDPLCKSYRVPFQPVIKELLRERLTDHTCDRRSNKTWIMEEYPNYAIEPNFSEDDLLWTGTGRWETAEEHMARKQILLEDIFETDSGTFLSLTTHSYAISAMLGILGLEEFRVREGCTIALLVQGERVGFGSRQPA